jgi:hypothetical protein
MQGGNEETVASDLWERLPRARVACKQGRFVVLGQRKKFRHLRLERIGAARRWSTTHERRAIVIVPKPNRMAQLMRDDIARDVGQIQRVGSVIPDPDHRLYLGSSLEARGKRNEITIRHRDDDITRHLFQAGRKIGTGLSIQDCSTKSFKKRRGHGFRRLCHCT